ncbi:ras-like protein [Anaeramoeba ignava]|uniref:small monomeric GTPase n=1 Tax=Anaeramoeba ignava TaxID=1746090 RepID=A0A9Q0LD97_ANAIG|nr:ras-like protein [Anaeramoeba ignava]|eukprot:Anaeramoba_ignava/a219094_239.p1 GENE.a219094_239~~a219094_239.p1  ORF type:complete len:200 (-),score=70.90 a219094_239:47-646(-)
MGDDLYKLVVIGGGSIGKSCLVVRYLQGKFIQDYDPTIEENYRKMVLVDDKPSMLEILDTAGQEEYRTVRDKYLKQGEGFLLCFSITDRASFSEARKLFENLKVAKRTDKIPIVTVGNKSDLEDERLINQEEGEELASKYNSVYIETSAKTGANVQAAFEELVRKVRKWKESKNSPNPQQENKTQKQEQPKKKKKCSLL